MARDIATLSAFNRGVISPLALARVDVERVGLSAAEQTNFIPRVMGSMMLRPGTQYVGGIDSTSHFLPFVFAKNDVALIQFENLTMKCWVGEQVVTRPTVTTTVANGTMTGSLTSWTDADESGASSDYSSTGVAGHTGGYMKLTGTGFAAAIRRQTLTIAAPVQNIEHALRITIESGPVRMRIGSASAGEEYVTETSLGTGVHSIAFTPTGANVYVQFSNRRKHSVYVDAVIIEQDRMILTSPYAVANLPLVRWAQSADVIFLACEGYQQYKIERRGARSWSLVKYEPEDGPFRTENLGPTNISSSAISGDVTLTASTPLFKTTHIGGLFRISSIGQQVTVSAGGANQWSDPIRVTGREAQRIFTITRTGTWTATVTLQRSVAEPGAWVDVTTYTTNGTVSYDDDLDDQIIWYRIGVDTGEYTSGTAVLSLSYSAGSITGVARITNVTTETSATAHVLKNLGNTAASNIWWEGAWSDRRAYPTAICLYEGRLWHAGRQFVWASVSDSYENFDDEVIGDSGPISRSIGEGPIDVINWIMPMQRLLISTDSTERSAKASSLDEPLTPSSFSLKQISSQGSAKINPVVMDSMGIFLQAAGRRLYALEFNTDASVSYDYAPNDLTALVPEITAPGVAGFAVQRQPDTRMHVVRTDGTVAIMIHDKLEDIRAWVEFETDGLVKQAIVMPGDVEDTVYYVVSRAGSLYLEKWALESECQGGALNKCLDSHVVHSGASTAVISGLDHLEGRTVSIWANGDDVGTKVVTSGQIVMNQAATHAVVGLTYRGRFKSVKLAYGSPAALTQRKRLAQVGLIMGATHRQGLKVGTDFDHLDPLPKVENGREVTADHADYDEEGIPLNGRWDSDSRLCLEANAPRHCTLLAAIVTLQTNEKTF